MESSDDEEESATLSPGEAFGILGNATRVDILRTLAEAGLGETLSFTALRDRVGIRQGAQFNYHLDKLVGHYVTKTNDGYALRPAGASRSRRSTSRSRPAASTLRWPFVQASTRWVSRFGTRRSTSHLLGHHFHLVRLDGGTTVDDVNGWMNWMSPEGLVADATEPGTFLDGAQTVLTQRLLDGDATERVYVHVNLRPGGYAWVSEVPDQKEKGLLQASPWVTLPVSAVDRRRPTTVGHATEASRARPPTTTSRR